MQDDIVLTMRGICKYFPNVKALENVDFTLRKGTIHALMGENGAGKSTLIKVLTGVYTMDKGEIRIDGVDNAIVIRSPQEAQNYGISTVYPGQPGHSRQTEADSGLLLSGGSADGCHCQGG